MKKRILTIFAAALLLAGLFAGCRGRKEPEPTPAPEPTPTVDPHAGQIEVTNGAGGTIWVNEAENLTPFPLDRYSFSVTDGVVTYARDDAGLMRGVDVAVYQGEIDWTAVAASGVQFAMVRIGGRGYSEGALYADTYYKENLEGARAAGLKVGAYFFSQATTVMEAAEEAVYSKKLLEGFTLDLPLFFDWEFIGVEPARTDNVSARTVTDCCLEFCRLLESEGIASGVYSYIPEVYDRYILNDLAGLTIWMGDPGNYPEFYYDHAIWQYSITGDIPGIEGNVDLDVMFISPEEAAALAAATPVPTVVPETHLVLPAETTPQPEAQG